MLSKGQVLGPRLTSGAKMNMIGIIQTSNIIRRARTLEQLKGSISQPLLDRHPKGISTFLRCLNWLQGTKSKRNQGSRRHLLFFWKPQKRIMSSAVKITYSCIQDASPFNGTQGWCEDMLSIPLKLKASDTEEVFHYLEYWFRVVKWMYRIPVLSGSSYSGLKKRFTRFTHFTSANV